MCGQVNTGVTQVREAAFRFANGFFSSFVRRNAIYLMCRKGERLDRVHSLPRTPERKKHVDDFISVAIHFSVQKNLQLVIGWKMNALNWPLSCNGRINENNFDELM